MTVTVWVLSLVMTLPKLSSSSTTGCVVNATPAMAVTDGSVVMTNWLADDAGLMVTLLEVAVKPPALVVKAMLIISATL